MANIGVNMQKSMLDFALVGGTGVVAPSAHYLGLSLGAPTSLWAGASEIGAGSNYARSTILFAPSATPSGSGTATNSAAVTFGTFGAAAVITGLFMADVVSGSAGNYLFYGNLAASRSVSSGDQLIVNSGALTITLS